MKRRTLLVAGTALVAGAAGAAIGAVASDDDDTGGIDTATLTTADGDPMTVAYSTTYREAGDSKATHTGTQIRVAAIGPGSERVTGVIDQTELHAIMLGE